jgi:hypothetical protein
MRRLRRGFALSDIVRLSACLALLGMAAALGGCAGDAGERVYGFQAFAGELGAGLGSSRMSHAQEEAIIGQAILAHETRRP